MARKYRCKCKATGEAGDTSTFIKTEDGYFKSQDIYDEWKKEKLEQQREEEQRKSVISFIATEYLGCPKGTKYPPYIAKKLKELKPYGYDIIQKTINENHSSIVWGMKNKDFAQIVYRINYIFAIISNNIVKVYNRKKREEDDKKLHEKIMETDLSVKMMVDDLNSSSPQVNLNKNKNIKRYLVEEDDY